MFIEPDPAALARSMEMAALLFGGSCWCVAVRNYASGWAYGIVAYDDAAAAFIQVTVFPGDGPQPADPIDVAAERLDLPLWVRNGLGRLDGFWGVSDGEAMRYVAFAPTNVPAGRGLRKVIGRIAGRAGAK